MVRYHWFRFLFVLRDDFICYYADTFLTIALALLYHEASTSAHEPSADLRHLPVRLLLLPYLAIVLLS
jgi:hypothetical protein